MKAEEWRICRQRLPAIKEQRIFLSADEFAYIGAPAGVIVQFPFRRG